MLLKEKLQELRTSRKAILATNFYNLETLQAILTAAKESRQPVILQLSPSSIEYIGLKTALGMARAALDEYDVQGWIHLDHAEEEDLVYRCIDAGFDSVMIDASKLPIADNVKITSRVVSYAVKSNTNVEAELGYIAKPGQEIGDSFTQPDDAASFASDTGVTALAVAIGNAHGFYKGRPDIRIDLLQRIAAATPVPLVLHGGSGIPADIIKAAIHSGIVKINIATEIKNRLMGELRDLLSKSDDIDLRRVFPPAIRSVSDLLNDKFKMIV